MGIVLDNLGHKSSALYAVFVYLFICQTTLDKDHSFIFWWMTAIPPLFRYAISNCAQCRIFFLGGGYSEHLHDLNGSAVGQRSIAPGFKPRPEYGRRVFHLSLRLITFAGRSAHLAYFVRKRGPLILPVVYYWTTGIPVSVIDTDFCTFYQRHLEYEADTCFAMRIFLV